MTENRGFTQRAPREELEDCLRQALMAPTSTAHDRVGALADAVLNTFVIAKVPPMQRVIVTGFTESGAMVQCNADEPIEINSEHITGVPWLFQQHLDDIAHDLSFLIPAEREVHRLDALWDAAGDLWDSEHPNADERWTDASEDIVYRYLKRIDNGEQPKQQLTT